MDPNLGQEFQVFVPKSNNPYGHYSQQYQHQQLQQHLQSARQARLQLPFKPTGGGNVPRDPPMAQPSRLAVLHQTNVAKGSVHTGLVPVQMIQPSLVKTWGHTRPLEPKRIQQEPPKNRHLTLARMAYIIPATRITGVKHLN